MTLITNLFVHWMIFWTGLSKKEWRQQIPLYFAHQFYRENPLLFSEWKKAIIKEACKRAFAEFIVTGKAHTVRNEVLPQLEAIRNQVKKTGKAV